MELLLLPIATNKVVLIPTTTILPTKDKPTLVKVVDHLVAKFVAWRAIMLITATNGMLGLIPLLILPKSSTHFVLFLDLRLLIGFWTLGIRPI